MHKKEQQPKPELSITKEKKPKKEKPDLEHISAIELLSKVYPIRAYLTKK